MTEILTPWERGGFAKEGPLAWVSPRMAERLFATIDVLAKAARTGWQNDQTAAVYRMIPSQENFDAWARARQAFSDSVIYVTAWLEERDEETG